MVQICWELRSQQHHSPGGDSTGSDIQDSQPVHSNRAGSQGEQECNGDVLRGKEICHMTTEVNLCLTTDSHKEPENR